MVKNNSKQLSEENSELRKELSDLKDKYGILVKKCASLEEKVVVCAKMKKFECDVCKAEFKTARDLKIHKKTHRPNMSSFKCEICEKLFNENWKMMAHMKTHHGNSCDKCEKTFRNENILKKHKQTR